MLREIGRWFLLVVGNLWALPNTVLSFVYLGIFALAGQVSFVCVTRWSIKLRVNPDTWLRRTMRNGGWGGWASGCFIILIQEVQSYQRTVDHENRHVLQQYVFGILQPVIYILASIFIWLFLKNRHSYYDNIFERDARKATGQQVDIPKSSWKDPSDRWAWWLFVIVVSPWLMQ